MDQIVIYQTPNGQTAIDVRLENEPVWLNQMQITSLFKKDRTIITKHINNIFKEAELEEKSNVQKMHIINVHFYNLPYGLSRLASLFAKKPKNPI